ncbi:MAG: hypothetical protein R3178_09275, partial [Rhodothermales bacterium]|nr:hypothetical protein [Rhodothermales bacterium]
MLYLLLQRDPGHPIENHLSRLIEDLCLRSAHPLWNAKRVIALLNLSELGAVSKSTFYQGANKLDIGKTISASLNKQKRYIDIVQMSGTIHPGAPGSV